MKYLLLFITINIFPILICAQSTKDLDEKYGFRHFKFGSSPSQISNIRKQKDQYSKNPLVTTYDYVGKDIEYVANVKIKNISLTFYDNKLASIHVDLKDVTKEEFTAAEYKHVLIWLEQVYGKNWKLPLNEDGICLNGAIWAGEKVNLELLRLDFSKSKSDPIHFGFICGYINVFEKNLKKKIFESEF
jgi:hypothetical protein